MVHLGSLHASMPPAEHPCVVAEDGGGRYYSSQQIAAAWAWFERNGTTCITPRRAEVLNGAANRKNTGRPPSRFKKEFLASLELAAACSDGSEGANQLDCNITSPPRRYSFHGDSAPRFMSKEGCNITVRSASSRGFAGFSDQKHDLKLSKAYDNYGDGAAGSSLLDEFEVESVWQQFRHHISSSDIANVVDCSSRSTKSCMYAAKAVDRNVNSAANFGQNFEYAGQQSKHIMKSAPYYGLHDFEYGQQSPNDASSPRKCRGSSNYMPRDSSAHFNNHPPCKSPGKGFHLRGGSSPDFLHPLPRLRSTGKLGISSPTFCSSITTLDSIRIVHPANHPKSKPQTRLQDLSHILENCVDAGRMQSAVLQRNDNFGNDEELDHRHYHRHRHVHHHHHHHHHVLHHSGDNHVLLKQIMSQDGPKGRPTLQISKLHEAERMHKELLAQGQSHYYVDMNIEAHSQTDLGYAEKNEGIANDHLIHLPYLDYKDPSLLISCKSPHLHVSQLNSSQI
ncbi:hypothetical protein GOP47_0019247 [Adiantum capillus-veneris]|uniref:Uncharacterized protein n=1 Tax=Adiantum capillus-veneris TaxID=13818 RepID=A0A9D4Z8X1_ADICA|nr:hypothetical protein GOP47_0019247 [Adiantum capillus-veneris]